MQVWKVAVTTGALLVAAGTGAALPPEVHGQTAVARPSAQARAQVLAGRGSQIGVGIRDVDEADAKTGKTSSGVVIEDVTAGGPAETAGIKKGDIVVEFDGERVRSVRQFTRVVQETPAGRRVQAVVMRDGKSMTLTVEPREGSAFRLLGDMDLGGIEDFARNFSADFTRDFRWDVPAAPAPPARPAAPAAPGVPPVPPAPAAPPAIPDVQTFVWRTGNSLGLTVGELSPQLATYFGTKDGVLVTSVYDDSAAAKAGVRAGDVITTFNGASVTNLSELRRRMQRVEPGEEFTIGLVRDKKSMTVKGKAESQRSRRYTYTYTHTESML